MSPSLIYLRSFLKKETALSRSSDVILQKQTRFEYRNIALGNKLAIFCLVPFLSEKWH